jgi:prepilin-type N-terminal cleavage/methylation domain-containing protein
MLKPLEKKNKTAKKSAFSMLEMIFVLLIIGILSAIVLPKFSGLSDEAKIAKELSTMDGLVTTLELISKNYKDIYTPAWNGGGDGNTATFDFDNDGFEERFEYQKPINFHFDDTNEGVTNSNKKYDLYCKANSNSLLFRQLTIDGAKGIKLYAFTAAKSYGWSGAKAYNGDDILILTATASDRISGVDFPSVTVAGDGCDIAGKPDKNDFWVFNPSIYKIKVEPKKPDNIYFQEKTLPSFSIALFDVNSTTELSNADGKYIGEFVKITVFREGNQNNAIRNLREEECF